ncbi:MAG: hypothetical protein K6A82_04605 [Prevotella sp.]|nr:hypothetical protein [Prevotella sp.]
MRKHLQRNGKASDMQRDTSPLEKTHRHRPLGIIIALVCFVICLIMFTFYLLDRTGVLANWANTAMPHPSIRLEIICYIILSAVCLVTAVVLIKRSMRMGKTKSWWGALMILMIILISLILVGFIYCSFWVISEGWNTYSRTLLPYHGLDVYVGVAIGCVVCLATWKRWKRKDKIENIITFFLVSIPSVFVAFICLGIIEFAIFFSNAYGVKGTAESRQAVVMEMKPSYKHFSIHYLLYLPQHKIQLRVKTPMHTEIPVDSSCKLYVHKGLFGMYFADSLKEEGNSVATPLRNGWAKWAH